MDKIKKMDNIFNYKSFNCLNEYIAYNTRDNFDKYLKFYYGYNIDYINPIFNTTNGCWLESILLLLFDYDNKIRNHVNNYFDFCYLKCLLTNNNLTSSGSTELLNYLINNYNFNETISQLEELQIEEFLKRLDEVYNIKFYIENSNKYIFLKNYYNNKNNNNKIITDTKYNDKIELSKIVNNGDHLVYINKIGEKYCKIEYDNNNKISEYEPNNDLNLYYLYIENDINDINDKNNKNERIILLNNNNITKNINIDELNNIDNYNDFLNEYDKVIYNYIHKQNYDMINTIYHYAHKYNYIANLLKNELEEYNDDTLLKDELTKKLFIENLESIYNIYCQKIFVNENIENDKIYEEFKELYKNYMLNKDIIFMNIFNDNSFTTIITNDYTNNMQNKISKDVHIDNYFKRFNNDYNLEKYIKLLKIILNNKIYKDYIELKYIDLNKIYDNSNILDTYNKIMNDNDDIRKLTLTLIKKIICHNHK